MCRKRIYAAAGVLLSLAGLESSASAGIVGHWRFDEGTGTVAADGSGRGRNGFFEGAPKWTTPGWNDAGWCLEFGGADDRVTVEPFDLTGSGVTLAAWVKPSTFKDDARIVSKSAGGGTDLHYWAMILSGTGENNLEFRLRTNVGAASRFTAVDAHDLAAGEWTHLAVTWDAADPFMRQYKNGQQVRSDGKAGTAVATDPAVKIGIGNQSPTVPDGNRIRPFGGLVDEVLVVDRGLATEQMTDLTKGILPDWNRATDPKPADRAVAVDAPLFQWAKGETAILHDVYLGTSPDLGPADLVSPRQPLTLYYHGPGLQPGTAYYWRVDEIEMDMVTVHTGSVWSFTTQALTAYQPQPADGDRNVAPVVTLTWLPGKNVLKHRVYFSDSLEAVSQGTAAADKGEQNQTTFTPADLLEATTYYWRVDEVLIDGSLQAGPVWSFTTFLLVDDFESYTDEEGNRIYETWIDGWTNNTGSTVGYIQAPFAERTIVHGGKQSMPLDYNNVNAPFYSETELEFAPVANWTINGVDTLIVFFRGNVGNGAGTLYVAVQDSTNKLAIVTNPNATAVTTTTWTEWKIPLSNFTGVNPARVKKLYLGVGDRTNPAKGGAGRIYIDDIRVTKP